MVFLPGYDDIITLRDRIQEEKRFSDSSRLTATTTTIVIIMKLFRLA